MATVKKETPKVATAPAPTAQAETVSPKQEEVKLPESNIETEKAFLLRILHIQHEGGFGRHLDTIINDRIKSL